MAPDDKIKSESSYSIITAPFGYVRVSWQSDLQLSGIAYLQHKPKYDNRVSHPIIAQIKRYLCSPYYELPSHNYISQGTEFQKNVWNIIASIKIGTTITYGAIAQQLKSSAQAVGSACAANPLPLLIPCHRVVAKNAIGGFNGCSSTNTTAQALFYHNVKRWLLTYENAL